jgi:hypothetical protein
MSDVPPRMTMNDIVRISDERAEIERQLKQLQERLSLLSAPTKKGPESNQRLAAFKILRNFVSTKLRSGLLKANEQAGKTGTYHFVIRKMIEMNKVDNVYILCGSAETELRNQCYKDIEEWHGHATYKANIRCVFRTSFSHITMITKRTLIIIDESHLVERADQTLATFLSKHGLSMAGTSESMVADQTYILSVDATPYAEESAMLNKMCMPKFKVILQDGESYYGIKQYYEDGLIHPSFDMVSKGDDFKRLLQKYTQKYSLIRIRSENEDKPKMEQYAKDCGYDIVHFNSENDGKKSQIYITKKEADDHYEKYGTRIISLEEAPLKNTIVFINGKLRCGKRVPKKHIGFVWEAAAESKTDVIRQSLLGRMCGYINGKDPNYNVPAENKPLIFIPGGILKKEEKNKVVTMCDLERSIYSEIDKETVFTPRRANNIIPGRIQNKARRDGLEVFPCVPVRFKLNAERTADLRNNPSRTKILSWCLDTLIDKIEVLIENNINMTDEQKEEILYWVYNNDAEDCKLRRYQDVSNQSMHRCHVDAYLDECASKEHTSDGHEHPFLTFGVVYPEFTQHESIKTASIPGEVYAIFYTEAEGYVRTITKGSRVASVNDKTHFTVQAAPEIAACVAGGIFGFDPKIRADSDELFKQFSDIIEFSKKATCTVSKTITSFRCGEHITFQRHVYGGIEKIKEVFAALELKHSVKISYGVKKRAPTVSSFSDIELTYISWE